MTSLHSFSPETLSTNGFSAKQATRQRTIDLIKESDYWVPDPDGGYLNGDWMELCGHHDETLQTLLALNALHPGVSRYIGINSNPEVIQANQEFFKTATEAGQAVWIEGTWANVLADLSRFPNTRVVVFDSFNGVINTRIERILQDSKDFTEHLYRRNGTVLLVVNLALRGSKPGDGDRIVQDLIVWKENLCKGNRTQPSPHVYTSKKVPMQITWLPLGF